MLHMVVVLLYGFLDRELVLNNEELVCWCEHEYFLEEVIGISPEDTFVKWFHGPHQVRQDVWLKSWELGSSNNIL